MNKEKTLRELADERGLLLGAAVGPDRLLDENSPYVKTLIENFNCLVAEGCMKAKWLQPHPGEFNFAQSQPLVDFVERHNMKLRGHTLVWHHALPDWVKEQAVTPERAEEIIKEHILTVGRHYRGKVFAWDVVNEGLDSEGNGYRKNSLWYQALGEDYIEMAFRYAHEADPDAQLFYNDYDIEWRDDKFEHCYEMVKGLVESGVPIHGVGFQYHIWRVMDTPTCKSVQEKVRRINDLGLTVHFTELDVKIPTSMMDEDFELETYFYRGAIENALASKDCPAIILWGVTDRPSGQSGFINTLLHDKNYQPKKAHNAVADALRNWHVEDRQW